MSLAALAKAAHFSVGYLSKIENGLVPLSKSIAARCDAALRSGNELVDLVVSEHSEPRRTITPPRVDLPAPTAFFNGRDEELADILELLSDKSPDRRRIIALYGLPGSGKTELAVQVATELVKRYDAGLFLDLHGYTKPLPPVDVMNRIVRRLGVPGEAIPYDEDEQVALYRRTVRERRLLLVLDNAGDAGQVLPLLTPGRSDIIVTSRTRLAALDEAAHRLIGEISPAAARRLFIEVAGLPSQPDAATAERIDRVTALCGRLALAVRVAAARLPTLEGNADGTPLEELAGRLESFSAGIVLADGTRNVHAAISSSFDALPAETSRALLLMALHPGQDFDHRAACLLAGTTSSARLVRDLVDSALLQRQRAGRVGFHDLVGSIVAARAASDLSAEERETAIARLLEGTLHIAQHADLLITPGRFRVPAVTPGPATAFARFTNPQAAARWLDEEQHNLARIVELAADSGHPEISWKLAYALRDFFFRTKQWATWVRTHEIALASAITCGDRWAIAVTRGNLGLAYAETERFPEAQEQYEEALRLFRGLADPYGEANTLGHQAWVMHCLAKYREAGELCRAALAFYEDRGLRRNAAITLRTMALAESALGMHRLALAHLDQARVIFAEDKLLLDETMTHNCLGEVHSRIADLTAARKHFRLAQKRGVRGGSTYEQARALRGLAELALRAGRPEQAEVFGRQAERLYAGHVPVRHRAPRPRRPLDDAGAGE
ncbi:hypothetical protein ADL15_15545 [Actinoplanes awajinensis subsp. mycoplanecinus]|uniref:HTH cro/C1-type domain-containing protein n=2 Tax=Actinoplanes awajinensis TaxID=135946 RepID=A0A0X3UPS4_9ACTN|nr:hypothetical protein ADL15_15545 [Actinoplanes awajinensis subsp. mycoplanecinus]